MPSVLSSRDLQLLGYSKLEQVAGMSADEPSIVFRAAATAGIREVSETFIYLKSKATRSDAERALTQFGNNDSAIFVIPESLKTRQDLVSFFLSKKLQWHILSELLWKKTYALFKEYLESLQRDLHTEPYFVTPRRDSDPRSELDHELREFLKGTSSKSKGRLRVLCASACVGKTTLARHLASDLAANATRNQLVPIYVEAQHWSKIQLESVDALWEIISNSISMFGTAINISEPLFDHMLQQGLVCFIFDGFDELCGHRHFAFRAQDVLNELAGIASESDARVLLTTRTPYWESEVVNTPANVDRVDLAPFNTQQAKGYFGRRFASDTKDCDRAMSLYQELHKRIQPPSASGRNDARAKFANLPLCVSLVAECVARDVYSADAFQLEEGEVIEHAFLLLLCEREQTRQSLKTDARRQLTLFEDLTMLNPEKAMPDFSVEEIQDLGLDREDSSTLNSHPLLCRSQVAERYRFAYDFLPNYFKACHLATLIKSQSRQIDKDALCVLSAEANGKGFVLDYVKELCESVPLVRFREFYLAVQEIQPDAACFVFHLLRRIIPIALPNLSRRENSDKIFELIGGEAFTSQRQVKNAFLTGTIDNMEFSAVSFVGCRFSHVTLNDCTANRFTTFEFCIFSGELEFVNCSKEGWGEVEMSETCKFQSPANLAWEEFRGQMVGLREDHVKDALGLALSKFWYNGRLKGSLKKPNWYTGSLGHSVFCKKILESMLRHGVIEEIHISGVTEGGYSFDRNSVGDLQKFMDGRQLTGKIRAVFDELTQ